MKKWNIQSEEKVDFRMTLKKGPTSYDYLSKLGLERPTTEENMYANRRMDGQYAFMQINRDA